jgi:hypothetical protein
MLFKFKRIHSVEEIRNVVGYLLIIISFCSSFLFVASIKNGTRFPPLLWIAVIFFFFLIRWLSSYLIGIPAEFLISSIRSAEAMERTEITLNTQNELIYKQNEILENQNKLLERIIVDQNSLLERIIAENQKKS